MVNTLLFETDTDMVASMAARVLDMTSGGKLMASGLMSGGETARITVADGATS